jgi:hypothetical protein
MDYILIAVAAASLGSATASTTPPAASLVQRHYADAFTCEQAATFGATSPGIKLVCVAAENDASQHIAY